MVTPHWARRFPLVARPRPACIPLDARVDELVRLADAAHGDPVRASAVLNQAALLASDVGLPDLARVWCHEHARAVCARLPGDAKTAIHALEPVVNLARLRIRDGDGDNALRLLEALFEGVSARIDTEVDQGLVVPCSQLATTEDDHHEVVRWLWTVLLADGTRAMTTAGRWTDALDHLRTHNGVGNRMSDGRQVAVIAHLVAGDAQEAWQMVDSTVPGEPWEQAVAALLGALCGDHPPEPARERMWTAYIQVPWSAATAVFHTRLGLSVADVLGPHDDRTETVTHDLIGRILADRNGYCARELVAAIPQDTLRDAGPELSDLVRACGLDQRGLAQPVQARLDAAVQGALVAMCV
ncbi:hypothetical protein [Nocardiopsis sp. NRRL B-16309]|uniref:hypothetical protein n=1 Tax=Nocardiopsis sp. NRRL B-16309 TaxID=1519494 RepID=UPI0006AF1CE8|nr:hypothetical protein [Nocardiopsis sp. NRRL B-16309]KOX16916.1 hypothetical protein ADL05_09815 [Nocardiopsis sp. NRRL B-16309]